MRPRVFVTQPIAASALARLEAVAEVAINNDPLHICTRDELIARNTKLQDQMRR